MPSWTSTVSPGAEAASAALMVVYGPSHWSTTRVSALAGAALSASAASATAIDLPPMRVTLSAGELAAQELSRAGARKRLGDHRVGLGDLEPRQALGDMGAQLVGAGCRRPGAQPHERRDGLAPLGVGPSQDRGLEHRGVRLEARLDLGGRDVLAAGDDRVGL